MQKGRCIEIAARNQAQLQVLDISPYRQGPGGQVSHRPNGIRSPSYSGHQHRCDRGKGEYGVDMDQIEIGNLTPKNPYQTWSEREACQRVLASSNAPNETHRQF